MQSNFLDGSRELAQIEQDRPLDGALLRKIISAINNVAKNASVAVFGSAPAPPPIDSIDVQGTMTDGTLMVPGEILHFVHTHNVPLQRGIQYVAEVDTDPNFPAPHPIDTGASRSGFVHLPALDSDSAQVTYYLRAVPQLHGSLPAKPTVFGTPLGPTPIQLSGTTAMSLLPSQAAGTARPGQGGQGIGKVLNRGPVGIPKRTV